MAFQGRSIQASVELDLAPLELSITKANEMLQGLGGAFEFKREPLVQLEQYMGKVRDIFKMVSDEALKINEAFNNIQGLKTFIENLEILKAKMETIANDVDKINMAILKSAESTQPVAQGMERVSVFSKEIGTYFANENKLLQSSLSLIQRKEKEMQGLLTVHKGVTEYFANENELMASSLSLVERKLAEEERELAILGDSFAIRERIASLVKSDTVTESDLVKLDDEQLAILRAIVGEEEKILNVQRQQTAEVSKQNAERTGGLTGGNGSKGGKNKLDKMGYLPSRIGSMALTMWGFNELMDIYNNTYSHINAEGQRDYFAKRIGMDTKALSNFKGEIASMQKQYQKLDMTVVGANALETASKYGVESESLGDLTKVMAIYGSEFVKQGRSQEDSILAINDALDGELRRLKEVGIGKEELQATGLWNGDESDKNGMILALLQIADERGYTKTAQEITNLSDAIQVLEVRLAIDLAQAFHIIEPILTETAKVFVGLLTIVEQLAKVIGDLGKALGSWLDSTFGKGTSTKFFDGINKGLGYLLAFLIMYKVADRIKEAVSGFELLGGAWEKLQGKFGKTKGMDKATESMGKMGQTTGGTVGSQTGSAKDGLKNWGKNLAKNLGKMAEVFIEVAVALVMAWALMKEAILLIEDLGNDFEAHKQGFEKGWAFLKDYGVWILAVGGAMAVLLQYTDKLPQTDWKSQAKAFGKLAVGLAVAMLLIGEAIALLIAPLKAMEVLGWMYGMLDQANIQKGNEVIGLYADALNYIASNDNIGYFIIGLTVASAVFGFSGDTVAVGMAVGIATALLLVAEAIVMLIAPLVAIEMLGHMANELDATAIQQGANAIKTVGECLQILEPSVRNILAVDFEVFGIGLVEKGNEIVNGKSGFKALTENILPNLFQFVKDVSNLEVPSEDVSSTVATITQIANSFAPMVTAIQKLTGLLGGDISISFMGFQIESNSGINSQLDKLYNDIKAVMDFANKLGGLGSVETANTTAITQTSSAITQLNTKLAQFVSTISSYATKVESASKTLGNALPNGFRSGASTFGSTVISVLASGIAQVQARYNTMNSGGKALGQKLVDGFKNHKPTLKTVTSKEIDYALDELDDAKDDFYSKGQSLGAELTRGYQDGADIHSPGLIARTTARELRYTMDALDVGKQMMYQGGVALGQALTNGYNSYGNLKTDVGVLASKGVNSEQLQANATSVQANTKGKGKTQESLTPTINIDMSNSTIIGIQDLNTRIQNAVETAIVRMNSPNGATGY